MCKNGWFQTAQAKILQFVGFCIFYITSGDEKVDMRDLTSGINRL